MAAATTAPGRFRVRRKWLRAIACLPAWRNPVKHNAQILEFIMALAGPSFQRAFDDFCSDPAGARLLRDKPDILTYLLDDAYLESLPRGSLGHAYRHFMQTNRFDAALYTEVHNIPDVAERLDWSDDFAWVIQRGLVLHDILHTLGGYGPDVGGEIGVIAFTHGQAPNPGTLAFLALGLALPSGIPRRQLLRFWREAVARGKAADILMAQPYEQLLATPLDDVRARLGVLAPDEAHPAGMPWSDFRFGRRKQDFVYDEVFGPYAYDPNAEPAA